MTRKRRVGGRELNNLSSTGGRGGCKRDDSMLGISEKFVRRAFEEPHLQTCRRTLIIIMMITVHAAEAQLPLFL